MSTLFNLDDSLRKATEVFLFRDDQILLGYKKSGLGKGKRLGIGGKGEQGETVQQTAVREIYEEISITLAETALQPIAIIDFIFPSKTEWSMQVHFFFVHNWDGIPQETSEIRPEFYPIEEVPYQNMWQDTRLWFPQALKGKRFLGRLTYGDDNEHVVNHTLIEWSDR